MNEFVCDAFLNLERILGDENISYSPSIDAMYDYKVSIKGIDFLALVQNFVSNANFLHILNKLNNLKKETSKPLLLLSNYISPKLSDKFIAEHINVLDASGNARIKTNMLIIHISGEKPLVPYCKKETSNKAFNETGLKLIFYLLQDDKNVQKSYRELKEQTQLSLGAIKNVFDELKAQKFIITSKKGRFLKNKSQLIDLWQMNYNLRLKPKLLLKRYTFINKEDRSKWMNFSLPIGMYWGGESASYIVNGFLMAEVFDIYTNENSLPLLKLGKFKPDERGEIRVYQKFWIEDTQSNIVPNLIIYADLMGSGDSRCLEAAKKIYNDEKISI